MRNIALKIAYDGANYHGFQKQKNSTAIANILEEKLSVLFNENILLTAAGRTDTGVHALGQVVNFFTEKNIPVEKVPVAINSLLPNDIIVQKAIEVSDDFSARFSATKKTYIYKIHQGDFKNPLLNNYAWYVKKDLNLNVITEALNILKGEHDFSSFQATYKGNTEKKKSPIRTLLETNLSVNNECFGSKIIEIKFSGKSFLYHQVRNMIGALVYLGTKRITLDKFKEIFFAKNRNLAPPTAPAAGLYLISIEYDKVFF